MNPRLALLAAAIRAYDAVYAQQRCPDCDATWEGDPECWWCAERKQAQHDHILQPPPERGYGYATRGDRCLKHDRWWTWDNPAKRCCDGPFQPFDDFKSLGYDPDKERRHDLEQWCQNMQIAADANLITEDEGNTAWRSATNHQTSSTSSTGTNSTPTKTTTTKQSFPASPFAAAGQRSTPRRRPGNRRS